MQNIYIFEQPFVFYLLTVWNNFQCFERFFLVEIKIVFTCIWHMRKALLIDTPQRVPFIFCGKCKHSYHLICNEWIRNYVRQPTGVSTNCTPRRHQHISRNAWYNERWLIKYFEIRPRSTWNSTVLWETVWEQRENTRRRRYEDGWLDVYTFLCACIRAFILSGESTRRRNGNYIITQQPRSILR